MIELNQLGENIWEHNHPYRPLGIQLGHRMTVVRLAGGGSDGALWVHSPTPLVGPLRIALAEQGSIHWVVVPNHFHDMYLRPYFNSYPRTFFAGVPGFAEKHPKLAFTHTLEDPTVQPWPDEIEWLPLLGIPAVNEAVFLHKPSRALIVADMVFNIREGTSLTRVAMKLNGIFGKLAASRFFRSRIKDRGALRNSVRQVLEWDFDRIVMGHGDVCATDGHATLERAYDWLLSE
jgi:hypothetical protein